MVVQDNGEQYMNKTIFNKFDKHRISELPRILFPGRIVTILSEGEAERAVDYLLSKSILGFDTETRPVFTKGRQNKVALLQVSTHDCCFLFRLNRIGLCPAVVRLLEAEGPLKIGLSWHDDLNALHKRGEFEPRGFIDLQDHMKELGIEDLSLAKLYANIFGQRISKREQLSNWEADVLSVKQQEYGATDAWACIRLYEEYLRLKETKDYTLEIVPEPELPLPVNPAPDDNTEVKANPRRARSANRKAVAKEAPRKKRVYKRKTAQEKVSTKESIR